MNFLFYSFINPPCSAAVQWMAIKCIFGGSVLGKASEISRPPFP